MINKRRNFLKTACAPVVFSMFSISMIEACSSGDDDGYGNTNTAGNNDGDDTVTDNSVTIDLSNSSFSNLTEIGGWMNYSSKNMLLLRISDTEIRAFTNVCPHQGSNNQWSHSDSKFICANHGRSFNDDCSSALTCFDTSIDDNILTVTVS
tara:strand:+ start:591 stop:1043 length:453 start_codon:yes stop_codon:yes gene_type:complete